MTGRDEAVATGVAHTGTVQVEGKRQPWHQGGNILDSGGQGRRDTVSVLQKCPGPSSGGRTQVGAALLNRARM